jgi:hypothetical protein
MKRLKTLLAGMLYALAAACAFGSYTPLIPPDDVVLPLGTAEVAGTYVQSSEDPTRWDPSTDNGIAEEYDLRQEGFGYWLDEDVWLVFGKMDGREGEYLMQIATPEDSVDGGYVYNYAMGKLVGDRLFVKFPDCDDLSIDSMNALELDSECALTSYEGLKQVIAETEGSAVYTTYYQLR